MKRTRLFAFTIVVVASIVGIFYFILHNTMSVSIEIANDEIIASDGRGSYINRADGVVLGYLFGGPGVIGGPFGIDTTQGTRSIYVDFDHAKWKDANLRDIPSILRSKNYRMILSFVIPPADLFRMNVGESFSSPDLQMIQIIYYDPDTGALAGFNTIHPAGDIFYGFLNAWINSSTPEPPQSLLEDGHLLFERVDEERWVLNADAWFVSYHRSYAVMDVFLKYYVKLSFVLTIIKRPIL